MQSGSSTNTPIPNAAKIISHPSTKLKTKQTATSSRSTTHNQSRKVSLDQTTVALDQASPAFKKSRITKNCDSTTTSTEGMYPWEGYMDKGLDNNDDPDSEYEPLYDDEVCIE